MGALQSCLLLTPQLRNISGGFYSNNYGGDPAPDRTVTTTEHNGGTVQHPVITLIATATVTPPNKGIMVSKH